MNGNMIETKVNNKSLSELKEEVLQLFECIKMVKKGKASVDMIRTKLEVVNKGIEINPRIRNIEKEESEVNNVSIKSLIEECKKANKKNISRLKKVVEKLYVGIDYVKTGYAGVNINWIIRGVEFINEGMAVISRINADLESYQAMMTDSENIQQ